MIETVVINNELKIEKIKKNLREIEGFFVGLLGFEPRQTESKSVVLPLHNNPIIFQKLNFGLQK